ncbi:MAG: low specificity L-threonine aldolase [Ruminococcaceae bacterium]|nr:low specificity L-threonine aldolase [Oscillospiraceae bacterium]
MIRFDCDYNESAHGAVLAAIAATAGEQHPGYGTDAHCARARDLIRSACDAPEAEVHFLVGGTQTNLTVIAAALRPWEGVIAPESGHIAAHETGAIEACGHKVLPLMHENGKLSAAAVAQAVEKARRDPNAEHIVQPALVYISQPTEYGALYSVSELAALHGACRAAGVRLFLDGARLGYALAADEGLTLADYARYCDVFTIGGTKLGCLFGEAVVITDKTLSPGFRNLTKQHGGLLAKGWLLGAQFETMFTDGLYLACGRAAVESARRIKAALAQKGLPLAFESPTNQLFVELTRAQSAALERDFALGHWDATGGETDVLRICTSWATTPQQTDALIAAIENL